MKKVILSALLLASTSAIAADTAVPLIAREKLFGNPSKTGGKLSPDGQWLSWLAPRNGVLNIYMAPVGDPGAAKPMTASADRPIRSYFWSPDSKALMYVQDKGGDENFLLYRVDAKTGAETTLTPFAKTRVQVVATSNTIQDRILVGLNNRDPRWHDVYSLDLNTGKLTEIMKADGYAGFLADDGLNLRMALRPNEAGGNDFFRVVDNKVEGTPFSSTTLEDSLTTNPAGFTTDGKTLYWIDSRGRNTAALVAQDVATGKTRVIGQSDKADIAEVMADPTTGEVEAYDVPYLRDEWVAIDPDVKGSLDWLKTRLKGDISVTSRTRADDKWLVANDPVTAPPKVYLYDRTAKTLTEFYTSRPELEGAPLVAMHPVEIAARDGLTLPSYLTLPAGSDPDGDGKPSKPLPMVLFVHGGPWARDDYGYNGYHQWMANRGYAVLSRELSRIDRLREEVHLGGRPAMGPQDA